MIDLLFWFLVSQTIAGLPEMMPGTEVRLVSQDLLTVFASARVDGRALTFEGPLEPGIEMRLLIFPPDASDKERAAVISGAHALVARIDDETNDILVHFVELDGPLSFRKWLWEERGLVLHLRKPEDR